MTETVDALARACRPRVLPVATIADPADAPPLAAALAAGGAEAIEVTFRTEAAPRVVATLADSGLVVGAGTIRTVAQVDEALAAGAQFVVSPALDADVVERCLDAGVPVLPGIATATELAHALALGLDTVKVFPAEPLGGAALVAALAAPFAEARFVPTGGLGQHNATEYLRLPQVLAIGGSWMVAPKLLAAREWETVTRLTAEAIALGLEV
ncbi:MAG: bifunctional 4-hydroxy-2-oxoglutarate aldolase/2-dehydro-3-deoxy-phosphogluconate aldolase [Gaiellaceae bacterium]